MFQFVTHVEFSSSMVAILEMLQYVAYQKNVAYALFTPLPNLTLLSDTAQQCHFMRLIFTLELKDGNRGWSVYAKHTRF